MKGDLEMIVGRLNIPRSSRRGSDGRMKKKEAQHFQENQTLRLLRSRHCCRHMGACLAIRIGKGF